MCGIVGLHRRDRNAPADLGARLATMLEALAERGPDSAGVGLYGDPVLTPPGTASVSVLTDGPDGPLEPAAVSAALTDLTSDAGPATATPVTAVVAGPTTVLSAATDPAALVTAVRRARPTAVVVGRGHELAVLKGAGDPRALVTAFDLPARTGWQGLGHTRMATESAVTSAHSHPFAIADDLCLVHNGSFANHATIRRSLIADGVRFDSDNDSEVAARFIAAHLAGGDDLTKALRRVCETFDGFFTLLVTTREEFAVVRDAIACKPALIAEAPGWVAMASEFSALATLPDLDDATIFEPEPEEVYVWSRRTT